ncbi:MAG: Holliday junction branch migration protein RuvA [Rhodospirillaceae bacterium]|nr:Holliday junction branch migration protein RuvA [Rhodospirillaceae bacterium]|tara:strand:- start:19660 stop:20268 length:609 start_codon:yes stop_codon:yes gene_type:complete
MIAKLTGVLDSIGDDNAVVDVAGVGYLVFCSARTLRAFGRTGEPVSLSIETHVREDHIHLYGFADDAERDWFRLLTTVQGVGAKVALAILSTLAPDELANAMMAEDKAALTRAPGVGPRLAVRLLAELREKASELSVVRHVDFGGTSAVDGAGAVSDAVSALVNLGYGRSAAFGAVSQAAQALGEDTSVEVLVKAGLQELSA